MPASLAPRPAVQPPVSREDLEHVLEHTGSIWKVLAGARIFITGGTGFVGRWLLESLLHANDCLNLKVAATVLTRNPDRFEMQSPHLASHAAIEFLKGDAGSFAFPNGDFPFVIHAATERSFPSDAIHPNSTFDLDVAATRRVLEFASLHGTRRLLFTSSGAAYGPQPPELANIPEDYNGAPSTTAEGSAYGQAKRVSEFLCTMYARQFGFDALIARLFAFVGPYLPLDENFAVGNFVGDVLEGRPIRVKGDGTPYRSYLYAADLAAWLWTILTKGESARPYNVGSGEPISIADVARTVAVVGERRSRVEILSRPVAGMPALRYVPSVERAQEELGLKPRIQFEEGIRRTLNWAASPPIYGQNLMREGKAT